jgi:hypothetical protein
MPNFARAAFAAVLLMLAAPAGATYHALPHYRIGGYIGYKSEGGPFWMEIAVAKETLAPYAGYVPLRLDCGNDTHPLHGSHLWIGYSQTDHPHTLTIDSDSVDSHGTRHVHWTYSHRQRAKNAEDLRVTSKVSVTAHGAVTATGVVSSRQERNNYQLTCRSLRGYEISHITT